MSLTVKHLNADSTFLLTFASHHSPSTRYSSKPSAFTILIDPWLTGPSKVLHPMFSITSHILPSAIQHLSEIPPPNVILISQDKPDHCHEETLRQLDPSLPHTIILAQPAAAKKIRAWKYFDPSRIYTLPVFSHKRSDSIVRFLIPSSTPDAKPGELTLAYIPAKRDLTQLHNAIGITYRPPATFSAFSPTDSTPTFFDSSSSADSRLSLPVPSSPYIENFPLTPPDTPDSDPFWPLSPTPSTSTRPSTSHTPNSSISSFPLPGFSPKTLSVLYSPHGVSYANILPYATTHLVSTASLPLTLLLHAFDRVQNPWYLGGNISAGLPGGIEIAQNLLAKCWIGAHDGDKDKSGVSTAKLAIKKYQVEEVKGMLAPGRGKVGLDVRVLGVGEEMVLGAG